MDINVIFVASLPIVYMLHDFEEIIGMKQWVKLNEMHLYRGVPKIASKLVPNLRGTETGGLGLGVDFLFL